jgi:osmotically-inducible protein OsmY
MDYRDEFDRGRRYRGEGYYSGYYGYPGEREEERRRREAHARGLLERLSDELRSWFGDEEAQRRRMRDEREQERTWGGSERGWGARDEQFDRDWARQWGYVEGPGRGGATSWQYRDRGYREPEGSTTPQRYASPSWTRDSGWGDPSAWGREGGASRDYGSGPHAGRGPRGYTRSDERIREDVCERLCEHGFVDASDIEVRVLSGEVTLLGAVRERQEKRIAEDVAQQIPGVRDVQNQLRVSQGGQEPGEQQGRPFRAA